MSPIIAEWLFMGLWTLGFLKSQLCVMTRSSYGIRTACNIIQTLQLWQPNLSIMAARPSSNLGFSDGGGGSISTIPLLSQITAFYLCLSVTKAAIGFRILEGMWRMYPLVMEPEPVPRTARLCCSLGPWGWRAKKVFHSSLVPVSHSVFLWPSATMTGVGLWTLGFQKLQADQTCPAWCLDSALVPLAWRAFLQLLHLVVSL